MRVSSIIVGREWVVRRELEVPSTAAATPSAAMIVSLDDGHAG
jgi:hypothetical protein